LNFSQLKYIVAVDKYRNFARAAEECDVAQSTLSKEIQRLEKEFGIVIFDRSRFPVAPTMKGVDLIVQAKTILALQKKFIDTAQIKSNQPKGEFRLGISPMLAPYLLPLFIETLAHDYKKLNIKVEELKMQEMIDQFEANQLDGAIVVSPFKKDGFYEKRLFEEDFVLYLSPQHPLFQKEKIDWNEIPFDDLLLHESLKDTFFPKDENGKAASHQLKNVNYLSGSLETIRKIIDRNGGITLLPKLATFYMGERRLKMVRTIQSEAPHRTIVLITPRGFEKTRITKVIIAEIQGNLPKD